MKLRFIIADDQAPIRVGLRGLLEASGEASVVAEAEDGHELLKRLDEVRCDVALLDLAMPRMSGFEVLRTLARRASHPPLVALSVHDSAAHVDRALSLGAAGYLLKNARVDEILTAARAALSGGAYIQPCVAQPLLRRHLVLTGGGEAPSGVSPRQRDLLRALALGLGNKAIADRLGIGEETVKSYLKELYPRIGVTSRAAAVAWAMRNQLVD